MKIALFFLILGLSFSPLSAEICEIIFEKVESGGNREWMDSPSLMCLANGGTCKRTEIECDPAYSNVTPAQGGGYVLSGRISAIYLVSVGITPPKTGSSDGANKSFLPQEFTVRISGCVQYSFLNNVTVSANSITTDSDGDFSVFVPVYQ